MHESQRYAAIIIDGVLGGNNLDHVFEKILKNPDDSVQQSQVKAITYGTLRYMGQSNYLIGKLIKNKIENRVLESLIHVAIYQLTQEAHTDFTVVDQAVRAAKKIDFRKSNLVNAVLRTFLRNKEKLIQGFAGQSESKYNYPLWWVDKMKEQYVEHWEDVLRIGNAHPPMTIRVNKKKITVEKYSDILRSNNINHAIIHGNALIIDTPINVMDVPGFVEGYFSVQDYGAQLASEYLDLEDGHWVLDACAAPGGKTTSILESHDVRLVSLEKNPLRALRIEENLLRLGLQAKVIKEPLDNDNKWWDRQAFDRILLDVPCSASGIVRRHIDIKWLRRPSDFVNYGKSQLELLNNAWPLLKKNGKLLYVTCSVFQEENCDVIAAFCENHKDAIRGDIKFPEHVVSIKNQMLPSKHHDGLYYEILEKN